MTTTPDPETVTTCCGDNGAWGPRQGEPLITSCLLCPASGETYWRNSQGVRERRAATDQG